MTLFVLYNIYIIVVSVLYNIVVCRATNGFNIGLNFKKHGRVNGITICLGSQNSSKYLKKLVSWKFQAAKMWMVPRIMHHGGYLILWPQKRTGNAMGFKHLNATGMVPMASGPAGKVTWLTLAMPQVPKWPPASHHHLTIWTMLKIPCFCSMLLYVLRVE
jgi:hypothetical protein